MAGPETARGTKRPREELGSEAHERPTSRRKFEGKPKDPSKVFLSKLKSGVKEVSNAAKLAKVFETQRLVKKLKQARKEDDGDGAEIKSLEGQLSALKTIDHRHVSTYALSLRISKDHFLKSNDLCTSAVVAELPTPVSPPDPTSDDAKAWNRLLSSRKLSSVIVSVLSSLRQALGSGELAPNKSAASATKGVQRATSVQKPRPKSGLTPGGDPIETELADISSEESDGEESGFGDHSPSPGEPLGGLEASELGSGSDWESGSVHSSGSAKGAEKAEDSDDDDASDVSGVWKRGESTFLPSLNHGFVAGSDGSDYGEVDVAPERKNRRGQRARKAIWEKKYGKNANHVKKRQEEMATVNTRGKMARASASRGANFSSSRGRGVPTRGRPDNGYSGRGRGSGGRGGTGAARGGVPTQRGGHSMAPSAAQRTTGQRPDNGFEPPRANKEERPIHPSWAAKLNEKMSARVVRPQGTKIVFD